MSEKSNIVEDPLIEARLQAETCCKDMFLHLNIDGKGTEQKPFEFGRWPGNIEGVVGGMLSGADVLKTAKYQGNVSSAVSTEEIAEFDPEIAMFFEWNGKIIGIDANGKIDGAMDEDLREALKSTAQDILEKRERIVQEYKSGIETKQENVEPKTNFLGRILSKIRPRE